MNPLRVKICGINSEAAFDAAIEAGADWVGFVFFPPSPRFVTPARAAQLSLRHPGGPPRVGLFVAPTEADIGTTLAALRHAGLEVTHEAYKKGIRYLLNTQRKDGAWVVQTRSPPLQRYFDNGDAGGRSQFISFAATSWAVIALLETMPLKKA